MAKSIHPTVTGLRKMAERINAVAERNGAAQRIQAGINRLSRSAELLDNVMALRNPKETPAAHKLRVAESARKFDSEVLRFLNTYLVDYGRGREEIQRRIVEKVNLKPNEFAPEIRARFYSLNGEQRAEFINKLVDEGKGPELAAIVKAPSVLSGINDEQSAVYEKMIVSKHAAAELDELAALDEVFSAADAAQRAATEMAKELIDPATLSQIERQSAEADEAALAFNQAISEQPGV